MPAGAQTLANAAALLKEWYTDEKVRELGYTTNPWLGLCTKYNKFFGDVLNIPMAYAYPLHSATYATAHTNRGSVASKAFLLTRVSDYAVAEIGREAILASENDQGAFMRVQKSNVDGAIRSVSRSLAIAMYRSTTGTIGQISSTSNVATATITLADINDITNFEVGQLLQASSGDGSGTRDAGATETLAGLDRDLGTLTATSVAWSTVITAIQANDYLTNAGDINVKMAGLAAWLPASAPGATTFFGVDRTADVTRLGGIRYDGSALSIEEALVNGQSRAAREGAMVDLFLMNNVQYRNLVNSLGSKVTYVDVGSTDAKIGFKALQVIGDKGPIAVVPDQNCPSQVAYGLESDSWKLCSLYDAPHIFDEGTGQEMLRTVDADTYQLKVGYYANLGCWAPGHNVRVGLAAAT